MAKDTLYNFNYASPVQVTREEYEDVGSGINILGDVKRAIKGGTDFEIWDSPTGGTQLVEGTDYDLKNIDTYYTDQAGFNVYTGYQITNVAYQTGSIYITYKIVGSYTDADFFNGMVSDIETIQQLKTRLTGANGGFWGEFVWKDADEIIVKPVGADGIDPFIGVILNDGTFLESSSSMTRQLAPSGSGGDILDGITAVLNNEWYIPWFFNNGGSLDLGFTWMPSTTFSNANPTSLLTLNQVNSQDIGLLFNPDSHLTIYQDANEWEALNGYQDGGAITADLTRDAPKVQSRTSTVITLGAILDNATFTASSYVFQVDNFKPLAVDDGLIVDSIGSSGYKDSGIRIRTDGSGNIYNFTIYNDMFIYINGSGSADYDSIQGHETVSGAGVIRSTFVPPDKIGYMNGGSSGSDQTVLAYWCDYGTQYGYARIPVRYAEFKHGLIGLGSGDWYVRGYVI